MVTDAWQLEQVTVIGSGPNMILGEILVQQGLQGAGV